MASHSELTDLDYNSAEHTGFASEADLTSVSGALQMYVSENYLPLNISSDMMITSTHVIHGTKNVAKFSTVGFIAYTNGNKNWETSINGMYLYNSSGDYAEITPSCFVNCASGDGITLRGKDSNENYFDLIKGDPDGPATLYYTGNKKFETTIGGISVVGGIKIGTTTITNLGTIRYTINGFEGYHNGEWLSFITSSGTAGGEPSDRGVFAGGVRNNSENQTMDYITISTTGNATDFGDLTVARIGAGSVSNGSDDRGCFAGTGNVIDYITISTISNAIDFGDLTVSRYQNAGCSNGTNERGLIAGGETSINSIDYITISTTNNATDFGDLTLGRARLGGCSNKTNERGVWFGGWTTAVKNTIDYVTISTTGNATDFGDLTIVRQGVGSASNGTEDRGVTFGGLSAGSSNVIDYVTISTTGNAIDFGDLTTVRPYTSATSNGVNNRGVSGGAYQYVNNIDYITISTTGNAADFGDLTSGSSHFTATSNA